MRQIVNRYERDNRDSAVCAQYGAIYCDFDQHIWYVYVCCNQQEEMRSKCIKIYFANSFHCIDFNAFISINFTGLYQKNRNGSFSR